MTYWCAGLTIEISGLSVWLMKDERCGNSCLKFTEKLKHSFDIHRPMDIILYIIYEGRTESHEQLFLHAN